MKVNQLIPLRENAIAAYGDFGPTEITLGFLSLNVLTLKYGKISNFPSIAKFDNLEVYKLKTSEHYIIGRLVEKGTFKKFEVLFRITLKSYKIPKLNSKFYNVETVETSTTYQGYGIATAAYEYLVKELKLNLLGDEIQFFGARKLWTKLSKIVNISVDIIDIRNGLFLEKNVKLEHGSEDWDFDQRVWSYNEDKKYIRLILRDINKKEIRIND